jgi:hypothetical protein
MESRKKYRNLNNVMQKWKIVAAKVEQRLSNGVVSLNL